MLSVKEMSRAPAVKLGMIVVLILLLQIPLMMVGGGWWRSAQFGTPST